ncbi:putative RNA polymerase sigma-70/24 factor [Vibrio nigripulchritudo SO65]|uniref:sigma-70 family RNA polymerase sigma factor n=1 Tax=Vibrio nigripulchritudo TaxID=28173 RepID=UPI0003B1D7CA|nr:sigma-70 family RNA polymerase sigma factor [Vibrio nigripulchritudo]CCN35209.1 putative RNA polymerase sigma-70/24 factor [Vibrio nigripulchritudo AM115]CCN41376.1 putative RNA polymerase sigma-70/24 factor [Vibrio nigripulchritudo FTn2]CCN64739.1 putative RNA polymerase sigma-70/24 factor [Vibrio nigripulchritudo POn4]CCN76841.1 putative RNA polymerase sigma-70/24 factor [Vibrio nigripulchritudo SO65]
MDQLTDEQLMLRFSKGEHPAFAELYQRHKGSLYRYFVRQLGAQHKARAEELFQDVWFRVIDTRVSYEVTAKFTTWLYRIAHNMVIDEHRKKLSEDAYLNQVEQDDTIHLDENTLTQRKQSALKHCMEQLAPLQREAFLLKNEAGFSANQICEIVDAKAEAVKTRLRYAMNQLRDCLTRKLGSNL